MVVARSNCSRIVVVTSAWVVLPVWRSQSMREVTILPYGANSSSMSICVMLRGSPLTYRLAPLILSLLGRASDTCDKRQYTSWNRKKLRRLLIVTVKELLKSVNRNQIYRKNKSGTVLFLVHSVHCISENECDASLSLSLSSRSHHMHESPICPCLTTALLYLPNFLIIWGDWSYQSINRSHDWFMPSNVSDH